MKIGSLFALVVDDKSYGREAAKEAVLRLGYEEKNIVIARYGDEALDLYNRHINSGIKFGIVLTDYHMDVVNKNKEEDIRWGKKPEILDGVKLTEKILAVNPEQKIIVVSGGLDKDVLKEINDSGALAGLYKRKPEDNKFEEYVAAIENILITGKTYHAKGLLNRRLENQMRTALE